jgi:hypothetical protein
LSRPIPELPQRRPAVRAAEKLWLPVLGSPAVDEPLFYRPGAAGRRGEARLRAWSTEDDGRFVVLTWVSGLSIARVARALRGMLHERFGDPFALAELRIGSIDLILPPVPGEEQEWLRIFPAADGPHRAELDAWWDTYGDTVLSS